MTLNRLLNADGATVGYFTDDATGRAAMQAARVEWNEHYRAKPGYGAKCDACRSVATPIKPLELEDVEPGDGDRVEYMDMRIPISESYWVARVGERVANWLCFGATSVEVQRHEINRYRRPGKSNRNADLGGPAEVAGVLYVLTVKAPR